MRLTASRASITSSGGAVLDAIQQEDPTLDLNFEETKTLTDDVSGNNLVTFSRASSGTYVGSDGLIKTAVTDAPRFDHDPVTGESLGLLIEESRTNLFTDSEQFDQGWAKNSLSISANVSASPDGALNADQVTVNSDNSYAYIFQGKSINSGSTTTLSVWAKYVNSQYIWLLGGVKPDVFAYFDLSNGTVGSTNGYNCTITSNGNGWYRCSATITKTSATGVEEIGFGLTRTDNNPIDNAIGDSVYLWGAQVEAGSFPTSYIPTTSSTVTRAADVASITGTNFSGFHNASEGTYFIEAGASAGSSSAQARGLVVSDGSSTNRIGTNFKGPSAFNLFFQTSVGLRDLASNIAGLPRPIKAAIAYKSGDYRGAHDGQLALTSSDSQVPIVNQLSIGSTNYTSDGYLNGHIARLAYFPTRKTDQQLIDLTT
jgi:hypothetical protein